MIKVKKIHKFSYSGDVYNLQVKDNHNYFCDDILVSNCHQAKAYEINKIGKKCINADHRYGFTGTLSKSKSDNYNIQAVLGQKIFDLKSKDLIEDGILSKISIANIILKYPQDICQQYKKTNYNEEMKFLAEYSRRNLIFSWIFSNIQDGENVLILVRRIDHLKKIYDYLIENLDDKYGVYKVHGAIKAKQREEIRKTIEQEKNGIIVSNYQCYSLGVNIKRLHHIILASSMKSDITLPQSIGRGLRTHKEKDRVIIWDIVDNLKYKRRKNYVLKHFQKRLELYKEHEFKFFSKEIKLIDL